MRRRVPALAWMAGWTALASLASACHPVDGPSAVHVTVLFADAGAVAEAQFDHVTLVATSGTLVAVACLRATGGDGGTQTFEPTEAGDPCADYAPAWPDPPTVSAWSANQSVDFVFPSGSPVLVTATARLGGGPTVGSGSGAATAVIGGAQLALALQLSARGGACDLAFGEADAGFPLLGGCGSPVSTCCARGSSCRTTATACGADGEVVVDPALVEPACGAAVEAFAGEDLRPCVRPVLRAQFYRCQSPDATPCVPTADCDPPDASIVFSIGDRVRTYSLSCLPPLAFPASVVGAPGLGPTTVSLEMASSTDPRACLFAYGMTGLALAAPSLCAPAPSSDAGLARRDASLLHREKRAAVGVDERLGSP